MGDAIDGSPRPKPRTARKPRREPLARSLTFFCSNPQCDHDTWSPYEQARHMAMEFWEVAQALIRLAPDSREALKLTGGVILNELTDDECREGLRDYQRAMRAGEEPGMIARLKTWEHQRRDREGTLTPPAPRERCRNGHLKAENLVVVNLDGKRECRACRNERQRARIKRLSPEQRERKNQKLREWRAAQIEADPEYLDRDRERARTAGRERYARKKAEREAASVVG